MVRDTAVTLHVSSPLRSRCGAASELSIQAVSVRALLEEIRRIHPALHEGICDETGAVRRHINLFVNEEHIRDRDGLDTPLEPGDAVSIIPAVSGG